MTDQWKDRIIRGGVHGWSKLRPVLVSSMSMKSGSSPN